MSLQRYARRRDANEREIINALHDVGALVIQIDKPADLLVGFRQRWFLFEVIDGEKPESARKLTHDEALFALSCRIDHLPYTVITSAADALYELGLTDDRVRDR